MGQILWALVNVKCLVELEMKVCVENVACGICGKEFTPNSKQKTYCSVECRKEANRRRTRENRRKCAVPISILERESAKENAASRKRRELNRKELIKISQEARRAGMSYGKYVAMLSMEGSK